VKDILALFAFILSWLALPVLLVAAYDWFVLAPTRPRGVENPDALVPRYVRIANALVPFAIIAVVWRLGVPETFAWAKGVAEPLAWLALPIGVLCAIDSWIFAPRRAIAAGSIEVPDPVLLRIAYMLLPFLVVAVIVRMISAETLDFSAVLLVLSLATGVVWLIDNLAFRKKREQAAAAVTPKPLSLPEPGTVDYARSFFPVAFVVLIVRAFIFEPFRIPSDSMMPTLLDGDFIVVSKYSYGLRLPIVNKTILSTGKPQRGDVVVFRYPPDPKVNFIKRLVGLPGDHIEVHDDHLVVNGETIPLASSGSYNDGCYTGLQLSTEVLGTHSHNVMSCRTPIGLMPLGRHNGSQCDRKAVRENQGGWLCDAKPAEDGPDSNDHTFEIVPPDMYVMIGDNRDNSGDSRAWGYVPDANLVGKATRIWFNFDPQRSTVINWSRIGNGIE
jgi:signal peptidase I